MTALELTLLRPADFTILIGDFFIARLFAGTGDFAAAALAGFVAAADFFVVAFDVAFVVAFVVLVSSLDGLVVLLGEELIAILCFEGLIGLF